MQVGTFADSWSFCVQDLSAAPPFSLADLRNAIPEHCWEKNTARSFAYLVKDVAIVLGLAAGAYAANSWCVRSVQKLRPRRNWWSLPPRRCGALAALGRMFLSRLSI